MSTRKTLVFYDGGCPLCAREVAHYRKLDRAGRVEWMDLRRDPALLNALGVTPDRAMRRLHVLRDDGLLLDGAYAFAGLWSQLPYYRVLANVLYGTRSLGWLDRIYDRFARWRYRRRCDARNCLALDHEAGVS